jgi:hexokinase
MLQEELDALKAPVLVTALVNDSVATYMAQQYVCGGRAVLGGIFGTGTNGAYLEDLAPSPSSLPDHVVINTEWGGFDDQARLLPTVQYDLDLDQSCSGAPYWRHTSTIFDIWQSGLPRRCFSPGGFRRRCSHCSPKTLQRAP